MAATAGEVKIIMAADAATFSAAMDKMRSQLKQFGGSVQQASADTKKEFREAQGSIAVLGEEIGVTLPRHVRSFVASLPGVAKAMSAAFTGVAVFAIADAVFKAGEKIAEFVQRNQEAAAKLRAAQEEWGISVQKTYNSYEEKLLEAGIRADDLRGNHLAALHKQLELIDRQGFNQLESAFKSLEAAADKSFDAIKTSWLSVVANLSFSQAAGFKGTLERFGREYSSLLMQGRGNDAQALLNTTQQREEQNRADLITVRSKGVSDLMYRAAASRLYANGINDFSDETYNASTQTTQALEAQQNIAAYQRRLTTMNRSNAVLAAAPPSTFAVTDSLTSKFEQIQKSTIPGNVPDNVTRAQDALNGMLKDQADDVLHAGERWAQFNRELAQGYEQQAIGAAKFQELKAKIDETTGAITRHAAALQFAAEHTQEYQAQRKALTEELSRIQGDQSLTPVQRATQAAQVGNQISSLDRQRQMQQYQDQQLINSTTALQQLKDSAQQLAIEFSNLPEHITQIFDATLRNLNQTIIEAMSGNKSADFTKVGTGMLKGVANMGIEYVEGTALKWLIGKNPMAKLGTKDNPMWVRIAAAASTASGGIGGILGKILEHFGLGGGSKPAASGAGDVAGSAAGSALSVIGSVMGMAGFASGGPIPSNMPAIVGENGPEIFMPSTSGRIIPNNQAFGGGDTHFHIDARGSTDPAAVEASVHRAMRPYMRQIPSMAVASVHEYNSRVTRSARIGR